MPSPLPLNPDDQIILVDFELGIYRALKAKGVQPIIFYYKGKRSQEKKPKDDPYIADFSEVREARFDWPKRTEYLLNVEYQKIIDDVFLQATSNSFYSRFFTRDKGRRSYLVKRWSWLEINNHIYKSLYYFLDLLVKNKVNKIVFSDIPHEGTFVLLYLLARAMQIDCIICFQSQFANRFFMLKNAPFGGFFKTENLVISNSLPPKIDLPKVEKPFYMKKVANKHSIQRARIKSFFKLFTKSVFLMWLFKPERYKHTYYHFWKSLESLPSTRDPKFTSDYDPERKYVYFPLHLQPEMTTDSLGRQYADQLLAIEKLRAILPNDWVIYCKENPKQRRYMREPDFHERLTAIPGVILVHEICDSFELIRNSQFVATITGTAGWEALRMNKKVLLYGDVWYQSLPGVYNSEIVKSITDLELESPLDQETLEQGLAALSRFLHAGCIKKGYQVLIKDYDDLNNGRLVAEALCGG